MLNYTVARLSVGREKLVALFTCDTAESWPTVGSKVPDRLFCDFLVFLQYAVSWAKQMWTVRVTPDDKLQKVMKMS